MAWKMPWLNGEIIVRQKEMHAKDVSSKKGNPDKWQLHVGTLPYSVNFVSIEHDGRKMILGTGTEEQHHEIFRE